MALGTEEAAVNTAVDALIDAWIALGNHLAANAQTMIVLGNPTGGNLAADSRQGTAANIKAAFDVEHLHYVTNNPDTADNFALSINGIPLFWKVTDAAGALS